MDNPKIILPSIPMPISTVYNGQTHFLYFMQELPQASNIQIREIIQKEIREIGGLDEEAVNSLIKVQIDELRKELPKNPVEREEFERRLTELQDQIRQQIKEVNDRMDLIQSKLTELEKQLKELADRPAVPPSVVTPPVDTSNFITRAEVEEIMKNLREEFLQQIQDGSNDVESLLRRLSDYLQLLVLLKKLIEDTHYLIISESGKFNTTGLTRIEIIKQNLEEIRNKVQDLNRMQGKNIFKTVFGNFNPLVVEINNMIGRLTNSIGTLVIQGIDESMMEYFSEIINGLEINIQDLEVAENKYSKNTSCSIM